MSLLALWLATAGCRGMPRRPSVRPLRHRVGRALGERRRATPRRRATLAGSQGRPVEVEAGIDPFAGEPAVVAPAGARAVDGRRRRPRGARGARLRARASCATSTATAAKDAFAIVRPADGNDPGQARLLPGPPAARCDAGDLRPAAELARDASCTPIDRLEVVGGHPCSSSSARNARCARRARPVRWVAVVAARSDAEGAPRRDASPIRPARPALSVDADTSDRDGDGRDDVALRVTIEGGGAPLEPGPRVSATLAWLDRPAGLSRDAGRDRVVVRDRSRRRPPPRVRRGRRRRRRSPGTCARCARSGERRAPRAARRAWSAWRARARSGAARAARSRTRASRSSARTRRWAIRCARALALDRAERAARDADTPSRVTEAQGWVAPLAPARRRGPCARSRAVPVRARGSRAGVGAAGVRAGRQAPRADGRRGRARRSRPGRRERGGGTASTGRRASRRRTDPCAGSRPTIPATACRCARRSRPGEATTCATSRSPCRRRWPVAAPALAGRRRARSRSRGDRGASRRSSKASRSSSRRTSRARRRSRRSSISRPSAASPRSPDGKTYVIPTSAGLLVRGRRARVSFARASSTTRTPISARAS